MPQANHFDVIIIGTGAGGGTLAYHLAPSGKRVLLLERGGYLPREKDNWDSRAVFVDSRYKAKVGWKDKESKTFHPGIHYYVGGNTKVYGAALLRFRKQDFGEVTHHGGKSPAWPLSYEDLEHSVKRTTGILALCSLIPGTRPKSVGKTRRARPSTLASITTLAAIPKCTARRSYDFASRISARSPTTAGNPRPGRSATKIWNGITPRRSTSILYMDGTALT